MVNVKIIPYFFLILSFLSCQKSADQIFPELSSNISIKWEGGLYEGGITHGKPSGLGLHIDTINGNYYGYWKDGKRNGYGVYTDSLNNKFSGIWVNGVIESAHIEYYDGSIYDGAIDSVFQRSGLGTAWMVDGDIYDGNWCNGLKDGFGLGFTINRTTRVGYWSNNKYQGEKIMYSSDRVYGIDISRYQHTFGKISWNKLMITNLGVASKKKIKDGVTDFPVSFVYIKATQGVKIVSKYFKPDAISAMKNGIPRGAYHFFTTAPVNAQAQNFIRAVPKGYCNLPPMLDVELSEDQIFEMGGEDVLFRNIRQWMKIVQSYYGKEPVLYVGQTFVSNHLDEAPSYIKNYPLWIARYGEYKPYAHLLYWQLSQDGKVRGIKGYVDIDVFNGSKRRFQKYVSTGRLN